MKSVRTFFQKRQAKRAARYFNEANYGSVLKTVKTPVANDATGAVFLNLYRLMALKETGQDQWAEELATLNQNDWLGHLGQDEKNYVLVYLMDRLFGEIDITPYIQLKNVPEETRRALPIDMQDPKFFEFFRKRPRKNPAEKRVTLYGFDARKIVVPKTIRFSGNFYNHKLFCLGKGSSFFS